MRIRLTVFVVAIFAVLLPSSLSAAKLEATCSVSPAQAGVPFTITATSTRFPYEIRVQEPAPGVTSQTRLIYESPTQVQWTTYYSGDAVVSVYVYGQNLAHKQVVAVCPFTVS